MNREELLLEMDGLLGGGQHPLTNLANAAALLWQRLKGINWAGFYLLDGGALWLAPFQGKPACTRIEPGKGVCGTALVENRTLVVPDVHAFPGHIACDTASRSEIVVPLRLQGRPIGVLDIDSPTVRRFDDADRIMLEAVAHLIEKQTDLSHMTYTLR